ncbi:MAG: phage portal protein, partial [Desulfobacteraceae bacterium]|nr:phage portal protein [Desulfobacteraceae bacterium]
NRNDPVASGATDTLKQNIIGNGLRPQSAIRGDRLGISEERASVLRRQAESAWSIFTPLADAANVMDFDEIQFLAMSKIIEDGETIAIPTWGTEPWRPFGRCVELLESERLRAPSKLSTAKSGIEFGARGEPKTYYISKIDHKTGRVSSETTAIPARDRSGRPKIIHAYPTKRPGQTRGIPFFAPVLTYFKDLADYLEAEVVAARVAACLAVFITKNDPMSGALSMGATTETGGARVQGIEPGMVGYLGLNESIQVVDPKRPGDAFPAFIETILRLIGVSIGLPYELIAKDFSKTNYSSARASLLEGRRVFKSWRSWFSRRFCQPIWDLVLEEAYLRGMFDAPDFYENRHEYTRAAWIGGGWGWVDPVKEVEASRLAIDYGLSTLAEEVAGQGRDWEEVLEQRAREQARAKELDVTLMSSGKGNKENGDTAEKGE